MINHAKKVNGGMNATWKRSKDFCEKFCFVSEHEEIRQLFCNTIQITQIGKNQKSSLGAKFGFTTYFPIVTGYSFQMWDLCQDPAFKSLLPIYLANIRGIIYFYPLQEAIDEKWVMRVKSRADSEANIVFVGYETGLSLEPDKKDLNRVRIQASEGPVYSCYISLDQPESMFIIMDILIYVELQRRVREYPKYKYWKIKKYQRELVALGKKIGGYLPYGERASL